MNESRNSIKEKEKKLKKERNIAICRDRYTGLKPPAGSRNMFV